MTRFTRPLGLAVYELAAVDGSMPPRLRLAAYALGGVVRLERLRD
jgi:hypothetical protein